jgi:hypothetical protein
MIVVAAATTMSKAILAYWMMVAPRKRQTSIARRAV